MKRFLCILSMLMLVFLGADAQKEKIRDVYFPQIYQLSGMKSSSYFDKCITGGKDGKIYQVIVKTDKSKKEIVSLTSEFLLSLDFITSERLEKALREVNEEMSEYIVPIKFATGVSIHPLDREPLHVKVDMRFEFYEGGVKLSIENFDETFFLIYVVRYKDGSPTENMEKYNEFLQDAREAANSTSKFGKFMAKFDAIMEKDLRGSIGEIKGQIKETLDKANKKCLDALYKSRESLKEQEALFEKMIKDDEAGWYNLSDYYKKAENFKKNAGTEYYLNGLRKSIEEHRLYAFEHKRWERDVRYLFDGFFISLAEMLDGQIEGVAEDGVQTWIREGDLVVPTDPKMKAKYIKKKKSFTDYDSYDN